MRHRINLLFLTVVLFSLFLSCRQQEVQVSHQLKGDLNDNRVMLQGFYWESYKHGHPGKYSFIVPGVANEEKTWYEIVKEKAPEIRNGYFDLIWLPPPSEGSGGAGYGPTRLFSPNNMYGDSLQQREMLVELWNNGIEPLADIVINHRNGSLGWAKFANPSWDSKAVCKNDEAFTNSASEVYGLPEDQRGADEEYVQNYDPSRQSAYAYESFRDLDHTNPAVRKDILRYLLFLKSFGYRGWRYDMVHGYHAKHVGDYNKITKPTFSVGEYDWGRQDAQRGWIWYSATDSMLPGTERLKTASAVFDFSTHFTLENSIGSGCNNNPNYIALYGFGNGTGLMGDNTDNLPWKTRAVTFLENHDTGWRTNEDGSNEKDHEYDSFLNNWQVEQGYAYILTHPGIPCVFWKHYFDWGQELQAKIRALIIVRKVAGVNSGSDVFTQDNAREAGVYAAMVRGTLGYLYVRIGGSDDSWTPANSNYSDYMEYAAGNGWKVWVKLNNNIKNKEMQKPEPNPPLGTVPVPEKINDIIVPD